MNNYTDISDNEIRIIGADNPIKSIPEKGSDSNPNRKKPKFWRWIFVAIGAFIILTTLLVLSLLNVSHKRVVIEDVVDTVVYKNDVVETATPLPKAEPDIQITTDSINDIAFTLFTPEGCHPRLHVGEVDTLDTNIMLCAQAADIRSDNGEIVSAFILNGEPLTRGVAKRGFCAIIGDSITLGMAEETPLYERAVSTKGDFFRQYPLVHDSAMQESNLKGKALRKALCMINGKISIVMTNDKESMHDFAQALQDYGVSEAISLTGADANMFWRNGKGELTVYSHHKSLPNHNYIIFEK